MASLDFAYDLTQKLADENIEYIVICVQRGEKINASNIFMNIKHADTIPAFTKSITEVLHEIDKNSE
jgi:hypothetical protein